MSDDLPCEDRTINQMRTALEVWISGELEVS